MTMLGPIMLDLKGPELTEEECEILQHPQVGGIILFTRNYEHPTQLVALIKAIQKTSHTRLLIAVDHEGGRVQRFREGFTQLPPLGNLGQLYERDSAKAQLLAETAAWLMASELLTMGVDFSFAPVLDVNKGISTVIGDRAFHQDTNVITTLAKSYIKGLQKAGMIAVGKHFPGHGSVVADSHHEIPIDNRDYETIANDDLTPFTELATSLQGIMPAHVIYQAVDTLPAGFSPFWLQKILREKLTFTGAIFSDDLSMAGAHVVGDITERTKLALKAGCDCLLICNNRVDAISILEYLERQQISEQNIRSARLLKLYGRGTLTREQLQQTDAWQHAVTELNQLI